MDSDWRMLMEKIGYLVEQVEAQKNEIQQLRAQNNDLVVYLVNKLGPDEKSAVRIKQKGRDE